MSIHAEIAAHIAAGRLYPIRPVIPSDPVERTLVVAEDVNQLIEGPWENTAMERRANRLRADLEAFVKGDVIGISLIPFEHKAAYMGRLDKPEHEVWDIRSRDPKPSLRVLGRFGETDLFVGLVWRPRSVGWGKRKSLGEATSFEWEFAKLECEETWERLFPGRAPKHGADLHDYISDKAFLV